MCGWPYLDTMHVDIANLIMWYLLIWWPDLKTGNAVATVRISRSFLWYVMNEVMHVKQRQVDAYNERTNWCMWHNLWYMDGHSSHSPWLNNGCKIECLQSQIFFRIKKSYIYIIILFFSKLGLSCDHLAFNVELPLWPPCLQYGAALQYQSRQIWSIEEFYRKIYASIVETPLR